MSTVYPVILSGGAGSRLWPASRRNYPKQFLPFLSDRSMLQETLDRVRDPALFAPPLMVASQAHRFLLAEQMRTAGVDPAAILLEPAGRNTAPAAALAALWLLERDEAAEMLLLPSDHAIADPTAFTRAVETARPAAAEGALVTFGIVPAYPETGYGYIRRGASRNEAGVYAVDAFVEKPDKATAEGYLTAGGYLWNSGMFLFRAATFLAELERFAPDMVTRAKEAMAGRQTDLDFERPAAGPFEAITGDSIDCAVMEKTGRAAVVPADIGWSDMGSWQSVWSLSPQDEAGNAVSGDVTVSGTRNCLLRADGPSIAAVGVADLVVVSTKDVVLVAPKDRSQDVKHLVDELKSNGRGEVDDHTRVMRPWGSHELTDSGGRFQTRRLIVEPGKRLSLQRHMHRSEHWVVVQGTAQVTLDQEEVLVAENESLYIPTGVPHRLANPGKIPLHLIEVRAGSYLGEDDIVRLDDDYGRVADGEPDRN